jgi:mRNA interferase RelE/StbE
MGPSAAREILDYPEERIQVANDPRAFGKPLRKSKHGLWRYRVRDYRIICRLEDSIVTVLVLSIGHRSTVYTG